MALNMDQLNQTAQKFEALALTLASIAWPLALLLVVADVLFGTNIGVVQRVVAITGMPVKEMLAWVVAGWLVYRTVIQK